VRILREDIDEDIERGLSEDIEKKQKVTYLDNTEAMAVNCEARTVPE
jgi:hypothetical protein